MQDYSVEQLEVGYETGADRLLLWLPMVVTHVIDDASPLSNWRHPEKVLHDSDATIVVVVSAHLAFCLHLSVALALVMDTLNCYCVALVVVLCIAVLIFLLGSGYVALVMTHF